MSVDGQSRYEVGMRLKDKIAIVVGAGQSPGEGLGNGRNHDWFHPKLCDQ